MAKRNCKQVNIPVVDNSKDECEFFVFSDCVSVTRKSSLINNVPGDDLNIYLEMLENIIKKQRAQIKLLIEKIYIIEQNNQNVDGIGLFDE